MILVATLTGIAVICFALALKGTNKVIEVGKEEEKSLYERLYPRENGKSIRVFVNFDEEIENGWVTDRSLGGLGLMICSKRKISIGQRLLIKSTDAPFNSLWIILEVRHVDLKGEHYYLGGKFLYRLDKEQLKSLKLMK